MKSAPNYRRWIVPGGWLLTAAAAFSIGRMSSWLEEPVNPAAAVQGAGAAAGSSAGAGGSGLGENRLGLPTTLSGENGQSLTVSEITGGQPLDAWLKKLMAQDDDIYRLQHFMKLFDALRTPEDIMTALKIMAPNGRGRGMRFTEYSMLLQKLTQIDPKSALTYATEQNGGERFMATGTVLRTWTKTEPEAALAWAKEHGVQPQQEGDANNDRGGNDNWALASVITQLGKTNLDRAIQEASSGELGRTAGRAADSLLNEAYDQRGAEGAKKIADSLPDGQFKNDFLQQLAGRLAKDDPAGASDWAMSMATGDAKRRALGQTVEAWLQADQSKALAFVSRLPVGPDSDSARSQTAQTVASTNQAAAIEQISKISDAERAARTVREIAGNMARKDQAAAQQFVAASPIVDESKAQIAQQISQPRGDRGGDFRARFGGPGGGGPGGFGGRRGN